MIHPDLGYDWRYEYCPTTNGRMVKKLMITIGTDDKPGHIWAAEWGVTPECVAKRVKWRFPLHKLTANRHRNKLGDRRAVAAKQSPIHGLGFVLERMFAVCVEGRV